MPTTTVVFKRLASSWGSCRAATASTACSGSDEAFQTLVIDEHVGPGEPAGPLLVQLLEGAAMGGTFTQMPVFVKPDGQISIAEIRACVSAL